MLVGRGQKIDVIKSNMIRTSVIEGEVFEIELYGSSG